MLHSQKQVFSLIRFIRFPLMVMVVMIHAHFSSISIQGIDYKFTLEAYPVYNNISYFISEILSRIAVPIFYIVSGYLFFSNVYHYNTNEYLQKIKRRFRTLVIPYVFWNLIVLVLYFIAQEVIPSFTSGQNKLIVDYNLRDCLTAFWAFNGTWMPICYQLWFIRDLFVAILLSPVIYYAVKTINLYYIGTVGILWLLNFRFGIIGLNITAICFFSIGAMVSINNYKLPHILAKARVSSYAVSLLLVTLEMVLFNMNRFFSISSTLLGVLYHACLFSLILACLTFLIDMQQKKNLNTSAFLHDSNFFIYAFHAMPLTMILKLLVKYIRPTHDIQALFIYFMAPILTILLGLLIFAILRKMFPKFTALITGSRV